MSLAKLIEIARSADSKVKGNRSNSTSNSEYDRALVEARRETLTNALYKDYIKIAYEPGDDRALFYSVKGKANMLGLAGALNGIILDLKTLKFVCVPSMGLTEVVNKKVIENLGEGKYDVYPAIDGTTVNIYHYGGKWQIATAKGVSVNSKKWYGITWTSVLRSVFDKFNVKLGGFSKDRTYSFTIQHPKFHPFVNDYGMNVISIVNNDKFNEKFDNNLRKPMDKRVIPNVGFQRRLNNMNIGKITKFNKTSIEHFLNTGVKNYGYILRRKNCNTFGCDVFISSALSNYIVDHVYNIKCDLQYNRTRFINLYNYLNNDSLYIRLFPNYQEEFNEINRLVQELIEKIYKGDKSVRRLESIISNNILFKDKGTETYKKQIAYLIMDKKHTEAIYNLIS